jgi:hypothetical protein
VAFFYVGCIPVALSESVIPEERWPLWGAVVVLWAALWLALVGAGGF